MGTSVFAEEHETLRGALSRLVARRLAALAAEWDQDGAVPRSAVAEVAALGILDPASGARTAVVAGEELASGLPGGVVAAILATMGAAELAVCCAPDDDRAAGLAEGRLTGALVGGWQGVPVAGAHVVVNALAADVFVIGGVALASSGDPGIGVEAVPAPFGWEAAGLGTVTVDEAAWPWKAADAQPDGDALPPRILAGRHLVAEAAAAVAAAQGLWEDTLRYAGEREAFGRPIGRFQVNRHAFADMTTRLTAARALVHDAAWRLDNRPGNGPDTGPDTAPDVGATVAAARLNAGRVVADVSDRCLQLHGGYGYTMEFPVQRVWRDARHWRSTGGAAAALRETAVRRLGPPGMP